MDTYLSAKAELGAIWTADQQDLVSQVTSIPEGKERELYSGSAPLLCLLNSVSLKLLNARNRHKPESEAIVFRSTHNKYLRNPFLETRFAPDVVATWATRSTLEGVVVSGVEHLPARNLNWSNLAVVGEVKIRKNPSNQITKYARSHLHLRPDLNAVLAFATTVKEYFLVYHDARALYQSPAYPWTPQPMYAFINRLYDDAFRDTSMTILRADGPIPTVAIKIGNHVYYSDSPDLHQPPGQRRMTAKVLGFTLPGVWFIKDIWRDIRRRYFEGLLYEKAHEARPIPGLMSIEAHGYVQDSQGGVLTTTILGDGPDNPRHKLRLLTRDVGQSLREIESLRQFLCVMYDACVVQRNLFRKSKILHRDISDGNIMIAPATDDFFNRCVDGYDEVKYINQVLAKNHSSNPRPACLVIDLGNGADLDTAQSNPDALAERTGTPKFIARSVSKTGVLAFKKTYRTDGVRMPKLDAISTDFYQYMGRTNFEELNRAVDDGLHPVSPPDVTFSHRLFHDAESMFWVIAWTLARSATLGYQPEEFTNDYLSFVWNMRNHYPSAIMDNRPDLLAQSEWELVLHQDLASMAPMLSRMHEYISPEWAFRPELDPEHAHEALMRLLLQEILQIDSGIKRDIPLRIGVRPIPPQKALHRTSSQSCSTPHTNDRDLSRSRSHLSLRTSLTDAAPTSPSGSSRKRTISHLSDIATSQRDLRTKLQDGNASTLRDLDDINATKSALDLPSSLEDSLRKFSESTASCPLRHPGSQNIQIQAESSV